MHPQVVQVSSKSSLEANLQQNRNKGAEDQAYQVDALNARPPWTDTGALPPGIVLSPKVLASFRNQREAIGVG